MTEAVIDTKKADRETTGKGVEAIKGLSTILSVAMLFTAILLFSDELASYTIDGLRAVALKVIPTSFPFMILSEMLSVYTYPESIPPLRWITVKLFRLPEGICGPLLLGTITGFPIGAKMISEQYKAKRVERESAEMALALANNPSPAFVIGTVGLGIFKSTIDGVILLVSIYSATLITGVLFGRKRNNSSYSDVFVRQKYNFVRSVKSAATSILYMSAFICAFYTLSSFIASLDIPLPLKSLLILPTEVTGAVLFIGKYAYFSKEFSLVLAAFALGFGGISVACQISALIGDTDLSIKKYLPMKLTEGLLSAGIAMLFILV